MNVDWQRHEQQVVQLQLLLQNTHGENTLVSRGRGSGKLPHVTRRPVPNESKRVVSVSSLDSILGLEGNSVWVEPGVTMERLCRWTLKRKLIPEVVCEFKGITVGGAVMGAALESSSFREGQFSDTCDAYELLLGDGRILHASSEQNQDLFYGVSGSYGSLASLTAARVRLVPAKGMVRLCYHIVEDLERLKDEIERLCQNDLRPDFLDGIVLDSKRAVLMAGYQVAADKLPAGARLERLEGFWRPWFIQHILDRIKSKSLGETIEDFFPLWDYIFRFDRSAFWMGQFCTDWRLFVRYMTRWNVSSPEMIQSLRSAEERGSTTLSPSLLFRLLCGWKMSSGSLYKGLHALPTDVLARKYVIQDFYIPMVSLRAFLEHVRREVGIYPLWLCPVRGTQNGQFLSPHFHENASQSTLPDFVNVGVYGVPHHGREAPETTRALESLAHHLGGRKMLYALNYIPEAEFWRTYDRVRYLALRREYAGEGLWEDFYEKTHSHTRLAAEAKA